MRTLRSDSRKRPLSKLALWQQLKIATTSQKYAPSALLGAKGSHWVHASRAFRRNPDREQGNDAQEDRRRDESDRIQGLHSKEKAGQKAREPEGSASTKGYADER